MGYSVSFDGLDKAIKALKSKVPNLEYFNSIEGNAYGDYLFKAEGGKWIVNHRDFSVWKEEKGRFKWGDWVEVGEWD